MLLLAVRCIELEIRDGKDGPEVRPEQMITSLDLEEVLNIINKYAFVSTDLPLIISLENYCSPCNQRIVAQLLVRVFGQKLVKPPVKHVKKNTRLPPLRSLKKRIIIQGWKNLLPADKPDLIVKAVEKHEVRMSDLG